MYKVLLTNRAEKSLGKIPDVYQGRIIIVLKKLKSNPYFGKKLEGRYKDNYSLRVWPYRIIYQIRKKELIIEVIEITQREGAYKK